MKIIHVDMDQFYAAVEQRDNPELKGKPIAVGYDAERGVVSTASYEARRYGVHSAQSIQVAKRLCPQLIIVEPHFQRYKEVSAQLHEDRKPPTRCTAWASSRVETCVRSPFPDSIRYSVRRASFSMTSPEASTTDLSFLNGSASPSAVSAPSPMTSARMPLSPSSCTMPLSSWNDASPRPLSRAGR